MKYIKRGILNYFEICVKFLQHFLVKYFIVHLHVRSFSCTQTRQPTRVRVLAPKRQKLHSVRPNCRRKSLFRGPVVKIVSSPGREKLVT